MFGYAGLLIGILSFPAFAMMETKVPMLIWLAITFIISMFGIFPTQN